MYRLSYAECPYGYGQVDAPRYRLTPAAAAAIAASVRGQQQPTPETEPIPKAAGSGIGIAVVVGACAILGGYLLYRRSVARIGK